MKKSVFILTVLIIVLAAAAVVAANQYVLIESGGVPEGFQALAGLPDWALPLIFMGVGLGSLALYFGIQEGYTAKKQKEGYFGLPEPKGILEFNNPPIIDWATKGSRKSTKGTKAIKSRKSAGAIRYGAASATAFAAATKALSKAVAPLSRGISRLGSRKVTKPPRSKSKTPSLSPRSKAHNELYRKTLVED